jgi:hypothetical protein
MREMKGESLEGTYKENCKVIKNKFQNVINFQKIRIYEKLIKSRGKSRSQIKNDGR